jgi:hypothetical protein
MNIVLLFMTSEDGTHSGFRNVGKLTSHTVQNLQNQKTTAEMSEEFSFPIFDVR